MSTEPFRHGGLHLSRRQLLIGSAAAACTGLLTSCSGSANRIGAPAPTPATGPLRSSVPVERRKLVIIELDGGNDGLSTLVPIDDAAYHDARPTLAIAEDDLIDFSDGYAIPRYLDGLHRAGLAFLLGVGSPTPSLSHFEMMSRWQLGHPSQVPARGAGFVGRLCDELSEPEVIAGVGIGRLPSPMVISGRSTTITLPDAARLDIVPPEHAAARGGVLEALADFGRASEGGPDVDSRFARNLRAAIDVDEVLGALPPAPASDPMDESAAGFSRQMAFASQLLRSDASVRVVHARSRATIFDTHVGHAVDHPAAWASILPGLERLRADLAAADMTDEVLIVTISEFGRRVEESGGGLSHGSASCALVMGPVPTGTIGEHPSLTDLDEHGNLHPTVAFPRYLASMAAWMGVDPERVLPVAAEPVEGLRWT